MHALTREWVLKAEGDFHTASREARVRKFPNRVFPRHKLELK